MTRPRPAVRGHPQLAESSPIRRRPLARHSLFHPESSKVFIGEPYERAMAYYYRAILYWRDGQPDNAARATAAR